ncbi:hypothetical protein ACFQE5_10015 [Pseudonocardia hispaniensis]|uniref:Lipoprotein n=1 Tax=Pseudonocardia hispaniensis TaxID=904933 RepID=A0ABW1J2A7_9PSEU
MPSAPRPVRLALAACAALAVAGCSSLLPGSPATDPVAWVDRLCAATLPIAEVGSDGQNTDPAQVFEGWTTHMGEMRTAVATSLESLNSVGPSPIEGGDAAVEQLRTMIGALKDTLEVMQVHLQPGDSPDLSSLGTSLQSLDSLQNLQKLSESAQALGDNAALQAAAEQAPTCQKMRAQFGG